MMKEEEQKKNNAQPVSDDELAAVTGGDGMGQMIEGFRPDSYKCYYCDKVFKVSSRWSEHMDACPENPKNKK